MTAQDNVDAYSTCEPGNFVPIKWKCVGIEWPLHSIRTTSIRAALNYKFYSHSKVSLTYTATSTLDVEY
jgi:hypothetical protein